MSARSPRAGGFRTQGLALDEEGLLPEALDRAAAAGAKVLYTLPTLQNPTGRIMGAQRRADIAAIARARRLWIVEDDLYSAFAIGTAPPPITLLAPERCFYINGTSKALAPGLRTGYLITPDDDYFDRIQRLILAQVYAPATMGSSIATQWIEDGSADEIVAEVQAEMLARGRLAAERLGPGDQPARRPALPACLAADVRTRGRAAVGAGLARRGRRHSPHPPRSWTLPRYRGFAYASASPRIARSSASRSIVSPARSTVGAPNPPQP